MKRVIWFHTLLVAALLLRGCEKPYYLDSPAIPVPVYRYYSSAYSDLESSVRKMYDYRAVFTWEQYTELLATLTLPRFIVLPLEEMRSTYDNSRVVVGLRHDIDWNPFKAIEMAEMEKKLCIRATYFILPTASYYGVLDRSGLVRNICMD